MVNLAGQNKHGRAKAKPVALDAVVLAVVVAALQMVYGKHFTYLFPLDADFAVGGCGCDCGCMYCTGAGSAAWALREV